MLEQGVSSSVAGRRHPVALLFWSALLSLLLGQRVARAQCSFFCQDWCDESVLYCHRLACDPADPKDCPGTSCKEECGTTSRVGMVAQEEPGESKTILVQLVAGLAVAAICIGVCCWRIHHGRCRCIRAETEVTQTDQWLDRLEAGKDWQLNQGHVDSIMSKEHGPRAKEGECKITHELERQARRSQGSEGSSRSPSPKPSVVGDGAQGQKGNGDDCCNSDAGSTRSGRSNCSVSSKRRRSNFQRGRARRGASDGGGQSPMSGASPASSRSQSPWGSPRGRSPRSTETSRKHRVKAAGSRSPSPGGGGGSAGADASPANSSRTSSNEVVVGAAAAAVAADGGGGQRRGRSRSRRSARREVALADSGGSNGDSGPPSTEGDDVAAVAAAGSLLDSMLRARGPREAADAAMGEAKSEDAVIFRPGMLAPVAPPQPSEEDLTVSKDTLTQEGQRCLDDVLQAIDSGITGRYVGTVSRA
mmetsp:Transcript_103556/g.259668  ORF Transcript_103556/g.259668 Transcript_103556/m.259668 type:complete len:475 (+) Transcript_103556:85-1509(+)